MPRFTSTDCAGLPLYNGYKEEHMRIIVGVHPYELDPQRTVWQASEVRTAIGLLNQNRLSNVPLSPTLVRWNNPRGLAAIYYYHNLVQMALGRLGFAPTDASAVKVERSILQQVREGSNEIADLFKGGQHDGLLGTPEKWPPYWITPQEKIADLMDLQCRWKRDGDSAELARCIDRYGEWPGGNLYSNGQTDPLSITDEQVERYVAHREERRRLKELASCSK